MALHMSYFSKKRVSGNQQMREKWIRMPGYELGGIGG